MKFLPAISRLALLTATVLLAASCKNKEAEANPYANNPYYGPSGGGSAYGGGTAGGEYPDVQPTAPPPTDYGAGGGGYTAPPPAPSYGAGGGGGGGGGSTHTVAKGDTLFSLARRYNTTVSAIKSANGLSSDMIRIGQTLTIP